MTRELLALITKGERDRSRTCPTRNKTRGGHLKTRQNESSRKPSDADAIKLVPHQAAKLTYAFIFFANVRSSSFKA